MTLGGLYVEGFYVEGLIFGILRGVATDIKMLRSKFLAKMVSAKFAYQNTDPVCITPQYIYICDVFTRSKFVQIHFLYSRKLEFKCLYLESPCSAFIQVAPTFSKSCLKVAPFFLLLQISLALVNLLPSFLHI